MTPVQKDVRNHVMWILILVSVKKEHAGLPVKLDAIWDAKTVIRKTFRTMIPVFLKSQTNQHAKTAARISVKFNVAKIRKTQQNCPFVFIPAFRDVHTFVLRNCWKKNRIALRRAAAHHCRLLFYCGNSMCYTFLLYEETLCWIAI